MTPEIERVRRNQEQLSTASCFCVALVFYQTLAIFILYNAFWKALDPLHLGHSFSTIPYWGVWTVAPLWESRKLGTALLLFGHAYLFKKSFFKIFVLCGLFFKGFIEFVTILLLFYVLVGWLWGIWDPSSLTRDWTCTAYIERQSSNHSTTREVPIEELFIKQCGRHYPGHWYTEIDKTPSYLHGPHSLDGKSLKLHPNLKSRRAA